MAVARDELSLGRTDPELDLYEEEEEAPLGRRLTAEFLGTLLFVAIGTGAATVFGIGPAAGLEDLRALLAGAPGQDQIFTALLANTFSDILPVAFAFAGALAVLVYALGGVSGAHFNPAVTFALAVTRRFRWAEVVPYWLVQILGAIAGSVVVAGIYGKSGVSVGGSDILLGAPRLAEGVGFQQALLAEAFITFILVTAIMAVAVDPRAPKGFSGLGIGLALAAGIIVTASATGGSANFARALGPLVASWGAGEFLDYDVGNIPWKDLAAYALGPLVGGSAAALLYESISGLERFSPAPSPGAATGGTRPGESEPEPEPEPRRTSSWDVAETTGTTTRTTTGTTDTMGTTGTEAPKTSWPTRDKDPDA
ncbi:MAG TPA: aquaporin [Actinomycetota bacterium]|nr:aquaporin [Actinomycetota bacterium]